MNDSADETVLRKVEAKIARIGRNAHGVIYGSITVMALLLALGHGSDGPVETAVILFGSIFAIVLAEAFAKISSDAVQTRHSFGWSEIKKGWHHSAPTLAAVTVPTVLILVAAPGLYSLDTGVALAQAAAIGLLAIYGYSIGWVIYGRVFPSLMHGAFTGTIGCGLAGVKYLLH
ncbi:hypothetical protein SAMN05428995_11043 [Loktanella sp. DSM 29012]|nr:hypothetical protein SAMN05428995_11043 [Loktanella sp. DSM 29012]